MATIRRFEELEVWILSRELNLKIGKLIDNKNFEKNFRLIGQIEGSSGSIMDNIAEGFERGTKADFIRFLYYSKGSCSELRSQLYRALDRNYVSHEIFKELSLLVTRISLMLYKLISYLCNSPIKGARQKENICKK